MTRFGGKDPLGGIDDETSERELGQSRWQALVAIAIVAVVGAVLGGVATWLLGTGWTNGAVIGFSAVLGSVLGQRLVVLHRAGRGRR